MIIIILINLHLKLSKMTLEIIDYYFLLFHINFFLLSIHRLSLIIHSLFFHNYKFSYLNKYDQLYILINLRYQTKLAYRERERENRMKIICLI
jgi:hypothetical protein